MAGESEPRVRRVPVSDEGARRSGAADPEGVPEPPSFAPGCACPRLDPDDWHDAESDWSDVAFVRTRVAAFMGVPLRFARARAKLRRRAEAIGSVPEDTMLLLGPGRFLRPVMLEVEGAEPGAKGAVRPGGIAFSRLVSAPWGAMKERLRETRDRARIRYGREPDRVWIWYLTCQVCSVERDFETLFVAYYRQGRMER